ncbi:MAG TPA: exo-alpha-sialidase [Terrimicrobiaceae bacterium]|nr:exo-alpha-sialidase [Terrimicrobiaceae bacterium]
MLFPEIRQCAWIPFLRSRGRAMAGLAMGSLVCASPVPAQPVRPLAQDYVMVGESPDPENAPLYSPTILRLDSGRLVAAYNQSRDKKAVEPGEKFEVFLTSDDHGATWQTRARVEKVLQGRLFEAGGSIYYLSAGSKLSIMRSADQGASWSEPVVLDESGAGWHQTPANFWRAKGNVYLAVEHCASRSGNAWAVGEMAPVLMRARESDDLLRRESWTFASELPFRDIIPGYKENDPQIADFGVPFFKQAYPDRAPVGGKRTMSPMGWLESNVVQILDPDHYWYDPTGNTFHIFLRAHTGGTGYAALAKVVENADGTMTTSLESAPSGKTLLFLPFPGGQMRFHILYDEKTRKYWMLGSQATDSMTRADRLPDGRYDLPNNERNRLVLHFSTNMVDWCFAGVVAIGGGNRESRHYASMAFDGDDLVILSRSGDHRAKSAHNGNLITFHRVKNFRDLLY